LITAKAPAKINLTLEVLRRRPDGYHEIRSVIQAVDLHDTLCFTESPDILIKCDAPNWSADASLVGKAVKLLKESAAGKKGVVIEIEKRIPLLSGLGGDSSDAAAVLHGLNELWKLDLSPNRLLSLAASLGTDVPFFLHSGTALAEGRGDIITPLPPASRMWVVLVFSDVPLIPGKTARMYAALRPSHFTDGSITQRLVETLNGAGNLDFSLLFNSFENIAFEKYPGLNDYKEHLTKLGAPHVHLAGSGPALFALFEDETLAQEMFKRCKDQRMKANLAVTI
jgi:4-diphosphocytidyl-2-C-methyl-D-erythritol kinase